MLLSSDSMGELLSIELSFIIISITVYISCKKKYITKTDAKKQTFSNWSLQNSKKTFPSHWRRSGVFIVKSEHNSHLF